METIRQAHEQETDETSKKGGFAHYCKALQNKTRFPVFFTNRLQEVTSKTKRRNDVFF
ncbi:hypothetical protein [Acetobacter tropicalis]|uniref:Uncharacterized protein n=1 Tax=Acetobacter tropicalis TaxID=104102 RepID=A0A094YL56_9PROT|nr:hypothetical protein [Acetobacter tropicalis]KGB22730.1 hypothetical protein AtDm6_2122 [Acetobacter tropicalis]MBC9009803.1 hypothetical protein [Acetobacter tropicalis]MDO8172328.1 hypothetical protein [Acetobacter tropicalis]